MLSAQLLTLLVLYSAADGMWKIADPRLILDTTTTGQSSEIGRGTNSAPELLLRNDTGLAADVWALGCILFGLCTGSGNPPFPNERSIKNYAQSTGPITSSFLPEFNEVERQVLGTWITEMLERNPENRPNTGRLCSRFPELLNLLAPLLPEYRFEPGDRVFFSTTELLGTEVQIWPNGPQYEQTFPNGSTADQQEALIASRRDRLWARSMLLGETSPHVVWFKVYLGWTFFYGAQSSHAYGSAEFRRVRDLMEQNPNEWPNTTSITFGVAWTELQTNKYREARDSFQQAIDQLLRDDHGLDRYARTREYLRCESGIGEVLRRQGHSYKAIAKLKVVIACQIEAWGMEDTDTLDSGVMLAKTYFYVGDYQKAITLFSELYETLRRPEVMGAEHPDTLICVSFWAWSEVALNKNLEALRRFIDVLPRQMRVHVHDSCEVSDSYDGLKLAVEKLTGKGDNFAGLVHEAEDLLCLTKKWMKRPRKLGRN